MTISQVVRANKNNSISYIDSLFIFDSFSGGRLLRFLSFLLNSLIQIRIPNIKALEEPMEVQMLKILRTQRQLPNNQLDILIFQLQLLEHLPQIAYRYRILSISHTLKGHF